MIRVVSLFQQCEDRVHRIGQKQSVHIHYLVARGTIDEWFWSALSRKTQVVSLALNGECSEIVFTHLKYVATDVVTLALWSKIIKNPDVSNGLLTSLIPSLVGKGLIRWLFCLCFFFIFDHVVSRETLVSDFSKEGEGEGNCLRRYGFLRDHLILGIVIRDVLPCVALLSYVLF